MDEISSIRELVNLWPTRATLAGDLKKAYPGLKVSAAQVHKWAEKGSIPARYHFPVMVAGRLRKFPITADLIAQLHVPRMDAA